MNRFVIRQQLPSYNQYINQCRANKYGAASHKKQIENVISLYIRAALNKRELHPVETCEIKLIWHEKSKRRDCDNIQSAQKFILDAMVKCGIVKDDSRKYIRQIHHEIVDDKIDFVEVQIEEEC